MDDRVPATPAITLAKTMSGCTRPQLGASGTAAMTHFRHSGLHAHCHCVLHAAVASHATDLHPGEFTVCVATPSLEEEEKRKKHKKNTHTSTTAATKRRQTKRVMRLSSNRRPVFSYMSCLRIIQTQRSFRLHILFCRRHGMDMNFQSGQRKQW